MFKMRELKENRHKATTKKMVLCAKPIRVKANVKKSIETIKGFLLSNFETNQPDIGNPINELIGIASKIVPNSASFKLKNSFIVGIREAQVAKHKPDRKK